MQRACCAIPIWMSDTWPSYRSNESARRASSTSLGWLPSAENRSAPVSAPSVLGTGSIYVRGTSDVATPLDWHRTEVNKHSTPTSFFSAHADKSTHENGKARSWPAAASLVICRRVFRRRCRRPAARSILRWSHPC